MPFSAQSQTSVLPVASHDSYLINPASPLDEDRERSIKEELPCLLETPKGLDPSGRDLDMVNLGVLRRLMEE